MNRIGLKLLSSAALPLLLAAGCAHPSGNSNTSAGYSSIEAPLSPTSRDDTQRIYAGAGAPASSTAATISNESQEDWAIAQRVQQMLMDDKSLAPYPSKVAVTMDKSSHGTVILKGTVPNGKARKKLHDRIAAIPGVTKVDDQLKAGFSTTPSSVDMREVSK